MRSEREFCSFLECGSALLCRFGFSCFSCFCCAVRKNKPKTQKTKAAEQSTAALQKRAEVELMAVPTVFIH
jgi:hypothetical protein